MTTATAPDYGTAAGSDLGTEEGHASRQFADKASQLRSLLQEMTSLVPAAASEQFHNLRDSAADFLSTAKDGATNFGRKAYQRAKEHPTQTALYALGAAALTWWLLSRRNRDED